MKLLAGTVAFALAHAPAAFASAPPPSCSAPQPFKLSGERQVLPIVRVRDFPFFEAVVNGVEGRLMLDTGQEVGLFLNDHRVPLRDGKPAGDVLFGSGQRYSSRVNPWVRSVELAGALRYHCVRNVSSQDGSQLEDHITPDFIGWIGFGYFSDYALEIDYGKNEAIFYRSHGGGKQPYLDGESVEAVLHYTVRQLQNEPLVEVRIGSVDFVGSFDTAQHGTIYTSERTRDQLIREGALLPHLDEKGGKVYDVAGIRLGNTPVKDMRDLDVVTGAPFAAAKGIGLREVNIITLGYALLGQYKPVLDFPNRTIYLLRR